MTFPLLSEDAVSVMVIVVGVVSSSTTCGGEGGGGATRKMHTIQVKSEIYVMSSSENFI